MRILAGIVLLVIGMVFVIQTENIYKFFGPVGFAEKFLQTSGGSRLFYKLFGLLFIFVGLMLIFNLHQGIMMWIAKNLFGAYASPSAEEVRKSLEPVY